jgi:hypothetical protein
VSRFSDIRTGLAEALSTITSLRTYDTLPDNPAPPCALIAPRSVTFDSVFVRGADSFTFDVMILVRRASERSGQDELDAYCDSTGAQSVKTAIEADPTLGGRIDSLQVTGITTIGAVDIGESTYLQAVIAVDIIA